jgi:phosphoglycolate phosphatase
MTTKNTIIFDLDGTLLDTLADLAASANYALKEMGFPERTLEEVRRFVGNGVAVLIGRCLPEDSNEEICRKTLAIFKDHYERHCNDQTRPYDGIGALIRSLQDKGMKLAIVSNKPDSAVKDLTSIYFQGEISVAIGENEEGGIKKKPAPDTVFKALNILGSSSREAYYVGDSEVDIQTAANAGMDAILCAWGFRDEDYLRSMGAETIIHHPEELLDILS